ncbi:MAG: aminofutalosine synthase MqnE [Acidobacteria bacterium]|nr:aminofutalosine synthase MqnE [Acidobacteriota bacterium]
MQAETFERAGIADIAEKVWAGGRVSFEEGERLFACGDLAALGVLANHVCERKNGRVATYVFNTYLNYSNVCYLSCQFCSFARKPNQEGAFTHGTDELIGQAEEAYRQGANEVHMVGGLHPKLPFDFYTGLVRGIKQRCPGLTVKAFTAIEVRHLAEHVAKQSIRQTLEALRDAGLDSLTGGGAEIFDAAVRDQICRGKESADEWLEVHRTWHQMGMRSTCTMLYGHVENIGHRVDHLDQLRRLQDETGGFTSFIPYAFEPRNNALSHLGRATAYDELRTLAVSRIYLDNFGHLTGYWISLGLPLAQIALNFGVDDLHGTIFREYIFHMAGSQTPQQQTVETLEGAIRQAGRTPRRRDTFYARMPELVTA